MTTGWLLADALGMRSDALRTYSVFVRNLVLPCSIGIYDYERRNHQSVRINAELVVAETPGRREDDFAQVYNYETLVNGIKAIVGNGHINLVETLAERILAFCLEDTRIDAASVTVEKLDVYPEAESVGITLERRRVPRAARGDAAARQAEPT